MFRTRPKYVKVLIQEFDGNELIEPNKHYSKCIMLYDTTPGKVYKELLPILTGVPVKREYTKHKVGKKKYTLSPEGRRTKRRKMSTYWAKRRFLQKKEQLKN